MRPVLERVRGLIIYINEAFLKKWLHSLLKCGMISP